MRGKATNSRQAVGILMSPALEEISAYEVNRSLIKLIDTPAMSLSLSKNVFLIYEVLA